MVRILAISGYKPFELGIFKQEHEGITYIKKAIKKTLIPLIEDGLEWVLISGQLGVELWAAEIVYELREEYPELKLALLTPYLNQEVKWKEDNMEYYEYIASQADFVDSITKRDYESPIQLRQKNIFHVEKSDALLLVYDEEKDGTPKYLLETGKKKQEKVDYPIFLIGFYELQMIVEEENLKNNDF
ncbi:DUF1273 domain-containing protein [Metabacillus fastidiosus]|uniref:DUF1273 domain-containing protein n=1 Tax=Metabacillus fastidiosus TaxID=1458 RepID=UPI002E2061FD|nr:DUF1273 domain-containing protein [Metabacillus fastidiosus]